MTPPQKSPSEEAKAEAKACLQTGYSDAFETHEEMLVNRLALALDTHRERLKEAEKLLQSFGQIKDMIPILTPDDERFLAMVTLTAGEWRAIQAFLTHQKGPSK